ncbi:hypothetical protein [Schlesneria sp.]|uniref:hypothetical protein n=1 Tax=Schlesneria sp. TaxID=2762018 RepID=UPI002EE7B04B
MQFMRSGGPVDTVGQLIQGQDVVLRGAAQDVLREFGPPDVLNNQGISICPQHEQSWTGGEWWGILSVTVRSRTARLVRRGGGADGGFCKRIEVQGIACEMAALRQQIAAAGGERGVVIDDDKNSQIRDGKATALDASNRNEAPAPHHVV